MQVSEVTDFNLDGLAQDMTADKLREDLRKMHAQLVQAKNKTEALTLAAFEGASQAARLAPARPKVAVKAPAKTGVKTKSEVALYHLTDWQGAKLTTTYDTEVMIARVRRYLAKALDIVNIQRADHPVTKLVVVVTGDMIEGLFNFPTQPYEIDSTLFDQYVNVASLLVEVAEHGAANYETVEFVCEWGNHGRIGSKRAAVPKSDNADRMTYRLAQAMTQNLANVSWSISDEDVQRVEIGNYRALAIHGDEFGRNGFASPMTIVRMANYWRSGAYKPKGEFWPFRDVYLGHYHTHAEWPMANGEGRVFQTGSTESDNRYAMDSMASTATPSQRLHFIDPVKGRVTAQYQIYLES